METLTFLFTDIEGSTRLLRGLGQSAYAGVLADHHALIRAAIAGHDGVEEDTQGDGFFAVFSSPSACVAAAATMQQSLEAHAWPGGERVRVRMGAHTGEAERTTTGLVGLDVHRAARVAAVAHGGQVLLSETAAALVRASLPPGLTLTDLGAHRLKDLGRPEQIFQLGIPGQQAEFPPLRSLGNPDLPNNLPAQLATFVGRERELSEVKALVEGHRLVTLTGAGGAGKTRLSLQVAADLLDGSGDGVWLVEFAAILDEDGVVPAISAALGLARPQGRPALDALLDVLSAQRLLIVLDNCEHLIGACAKTADAISRRCPRVHLLATSREPLMIGGETIYRVPPLSLPGPVGGGEPATVTSSDAVALFVERAREQGVSLPADEQAGPLLASICARLDGMPLAIELAAARLRSLSLQDLHERLDQRFRLLTGGSRTALPRQQTLRAAVDWSYTLLNSAEQTLLRRLSVFAEGFDLDAVEAVCGFGDIDKLDVTGLLGSLVDKSLVVAEAADGGVRYRLLETIRQFAAELLAAAGEDEAAVEEAHLRHFLAVAEAAAPHLTGTDQGEWLARLDAVQANMRRAAERAARDESRTEQALRFGVALRYYWHAHSQDQEAVALLMPVLDRPDARADLRLFAAALVTVVMSLHTIDATAAVRLGDQAVEIGRQLADSRLLTEALALHCASYYFAGQLERSLPLGQEAVERARQLDDDYLLGLSLLGWLLPLGRLDRARAEPLFAEAIAVTERSGDLVVNWVLHNNAGVQALVSGNIPAARAHLEQAEQALRSIGNTDHHVSYNLGWVLRQENDRDAARSRFEATLRLSHRRGDRRSTAGACLGLACLATDCGDWQRAAELHGAAQTVADGMRTRWQPAEAYVRRESIDQAKSGLGEQMFERIYAKGVALSVDQAVDLALGRAHPG